MEAVRGKQPRGRADEEEVCNYFFFNSTEEELDKFEKVMVGIMVAPGLAYGVRQSLMEEGIFSIQATPLGPNICLLEETVEGDLEVLLQDGGDWKKRWFKEGRKWKPTDVECFRAAWILVYGIPFHVRNARFLEALLSNVGVIANFDFLERLPEILDVISLMVFTKMVEPIRSKINICMNGNWISLMIIEEVMMNSEHEEHSSGEDSSNSEYEASSFSSEHGRKDEEIVELKSPSGCTVPQVAVFGDGDFSMNVRS